MGYKATISDSLKLVKPIVGYTNGEAHYVRVSPLLLIHFYKAGVPKTVAPTIIGMKFHHHPLPSQFSSVAVFLKSIGIDVEERSASPWKPIYEGEFKFSLEITA